MSPLRRRLATIVVVPVVVLSSCTGEGSGDAYPVRSEVISDETTQDVLVLGPDAEGTWPVAMVYHGIDGRAEQMAVLGEELASAGVVVFAPNYRTDLAAASKASSTPSTTASADIASLGAWPPTTAATSTSR